jgi:hypothetical protein
VQNRMKIILAFYTYFLIFITLIHNVYAVSDSDFDYIITGWLPLFLLLVFIIWFLDAIYITD